MDPFYSDHIPSLADAEICPCRSRISCSFPYLNSCFVRKLEAAHDRKRSISTAASEPPVWHKVVVLGSQLRASASALPVLLSPPPCHLDERQPNSISLSSLSRGAVSSFVALFFFLLNCYPTLVLKSSYNILKCADHIPNPYVSSPHSPPHPCRRPRNTLSKTAIPTRRLHTHDPLLPCKAPLTSK